MTLSLDEKLNDLVGTFQKCLEAPEPFQDDEEKETCRKLVEALPDDLVDHAANTSYAYWYLTSKPETCPSEEVKIATAMREARRHLAYQGNNFDKALNNFTESCKYRKDQQLDLLRVCFNKDLDEKDREKAQEMAKQIEDDLSKQIVIMRGQDKGGRPTMIKFARMEEGTEEEPYVLAQIYVADRSTATAEFLSLGTEERSFAVYDYNGFESKNSPTVQAQIKAATLLQKLYPERLQTLVMVEPPFWLRGLMTLLGPFLSESITERIKMASGEEEKETVFGACMEPENSIPLLLKDAKLGSGVSLGHYLEDVPYYCLYDDVPCNRSPDEIKSTDVTVDTQSLTSSLWGSLTGSFTGTTA